MHAEILSLERILHIIHTRRSFYKLEIIQKTNKDYVIEKNVVEKET